MRPIVGRKIIEAVSLVKVERGTSVTYSTSPTSSLPFTHFYQSNGTRNERRIKAKYAREVEL